MLRFDLVDCVGWMVSVVFWLFGVMMWMGFKDVIVCKKVLLFLYDNLLVS